MGTRSAAAYKAFEFRVQRFRLRVQGLYIYRRNYKALGLQLQENFGGAEFRFRAREWNTLPETSLASTPLAGYEKVGWGGLGIESLSGMSSAEV